MKEIVASVVFACIAASTFAPLLARADSDLAYYQQFLYMKQTSDDGDGEVHSQFRYLMGSQEIPIDANQILIANVSLILNADMTSDLIYSEMFKIRENEQSEWKFQVHGICPTHVLGNWSVADQGLALPESITGSRDTWHSQNAVKLVFGKALGSPALAGQSVTLSYGYSNVDKDAATPPFCH